MTDTIEKYALPLPESMRDAPANERSVELARLWWHDGAPHVIVRPAISDPKFMGAILAELSWHFADGYAAQHGVPVEEALAGMREGWLHGHTQADEQATKKGAA